MRNQLHVSNDPEIIVMFNRFVSFVRMGNNGRTIILSIHQPRYSIYRLFDSLMLLVNGKQVSSIF